MSARRKVLIVLAGMVVLAAVCIVAFLFHGRTNKAFSFTPAENDPEFGVGEMNWESLPSLPPQKPIELTQPTRTTSPIVGATQFASPSPVLSPGRQLLFRRNLPSLTMQIGVVDVDRVLTLYGPTGDSREALTNALNQIELAVATRAAAHDCVIVLNESGNSLNKIPVVVYSADTLDLTDEVIAQLGH